MTKVPRAGQVKTRLIGPAINAEAAARLAEAFLADTLAAAARAATPPVRAYSPTLAADVLLAWDGDESDLPAALPESSRPARVFAQTGNSLGERLVNVTEHAFGMGYAALCVIGSDTPHLPDGFIREALGRLAADTADVVLGPAEDGGYYLIALNRPAPSLFEGIPWSTDGVLEATRDRIREAGLRAARLPTWYDIDTENDLKRLRRDLSRGTASASQTAQAIAFLNRDAPAFAMGGGGGSNIT